MPTWTTIAKPTATIYLERERPTWQLLVNSVDLLLINIGGDRLSVADGGYESYNKVTKPSTNYSEIIRPS